MVGSNIPGQKENNRDIPAPNWDYEYTVSNRSLWEVSAMAGDVAPIFSVVKQKKSIDQEWSRNYNIRISAMRKALQSDFKKFGDFVYFDPHLEFNSMIVKNENRTKIDLKKVQVDVISAIEFLWSRYGKDNLSKGLEIIHIKQKERRDYLASKSSKKKKNNYSSNFFEDDFKGSAENRQDKANATKELKRLQAMLYITLCSKIGISPDDECLYLELKSNLLDDIEDFGFKNVHGFGEDAIKSLVEKCFKAYWELREKNKEKIMVDNQ